MAPRSRSRSRRTCDDPDCDSSEHSAIEEEATALDSTLLLQVRCPSPIVKNVRNKKRKNRDDNNNNFEDEEQILFCNSLDSLQKIFHTDPTVQLAVWRRQRPPSWCDDLSRPTIDPELLPAFEGVLTPEICHQILTNYLCKGPYKLRSKQKNPLTDNQLHELVDEVETLVQAFCIVSDSELVNVKLEVVDDNGCRYWHQDSVPMRLVATYRGPCTEYVSPRFSEQTLLGRESDSPHTQSLTHCDVALFRGRGETDEDSPLLSNEGIVHRSPRIEGSGIHRLVLVLDIPREGWHY